MANWVLLLLLFLSCDDVLASWLGCACVDVWEGEHVGRLRIDLGGLASSGDPACGGDELEAKWTRLCALHGDGELGVGELVPGIGVELGDGTDGTEASEVKELNSLLDGWSETVVGEGA